MNNIFLKTLTVSVPFISLLIIIISKILLISSSLLSIFTFLLLIACVLISVHYAEDIAHALGQTIGTLILALSVTILEVGLILAFMLSGGDDSSTIARDTIFSALMIVCNGVVGLSIVIGGIKYHKQYFRVQGTNSIMVVLVALSFFTLVLPSYTTSIPGPYYNNFQLAFVAFASISIYVVFVLMQTVWHKKDFEAKRSIKVSSQNIPINKTDDINKSKLIKNFIMLVVSLVAVIALSKYLAPTIQSTLSSLGAPKEFIGIVMACIILLPETLAAVRASLQNKLQVTLNLALGSGAASIALTIPFVAIFAIITDTHLALGLDEQSLVFLILTFLISSFSLGTGKATLLQGSIHIFVLLFYLFLALIP